MQGKAAWDDRHGGKMLVTAMWLAAARRFGLHSISNGLPGRQARDLPERSLCQEFWNRTPRRPRPASSDPYETSQGVWRRFRHPVAVLL